MQKSSTALGMSEARKSLSKVILDYRVAADDYEKNAPNDNDKADEYASKTYMRPLDQIMAWTEPAQSFDEAVQALLLASEQLDMEHSMFMSTPLVRSALGYFRQRNMISYSRITYASLHDSYEAIANAAALSQLAHYNLDSGLMEVMPPVELTTALNSLQRTLKLIIGELSLPLELVGEMEQEIQR